MNKLVIALIVAAATSMPAYAQRPPADALGMPSDGLLTATGKALKDQLDCRNAPSPGSAIRSMMMNRLIAPTPYNADGSPVFTPTADIYVYGARIKFITGWGNGGNTIGLPLGGHPQTAPPLFLAVVFEALPEKVHYTAHKVRKPDGSLGSPFSTIEPRKGHTTLMPGTIITCCWRLRRQSFRRAEDAKALAIFLLAIETDQSPERQCDRRSGRQPLGERAISGSTSGALLVCIR